MSYYSQLRPFYSDAPAQRFRYLSFALQEICAAGQQQIQSFCELPPLEDTNRGTNSNQVCQIMIQTLDRIVREVNSGQISLETVTEEQLQYLRFDLRTWISVIAGCVTILKHLAHQDSAHNQVHYAVVILQLEKAVIDLRDVVDALYSYHERETS